MNDTEIREQIAKWAIRHSFATGHADTIGDLLCGVGFQIEEIRFKLKAVGELQEDWVISYQTKATGINEFLRGVAAGADKCASEIRAIIEEQS